MLVVSDATPINILITLGHEAILPALFQSIVIPPSVAEELSRPSTIERVRDLVASPPAWLKTVTPSSSAPSQSLRHRGEQDAMQLALELKADAILLDEHAARIRASKLGLRVIGTVGLLEQAANKGLIQDLAALHDRLRSSWFYVSDSILNESLARHGARMQKGN
jgi:predicted nucleic acid-binding protein